MLWTFMAVHPVFINVPICLWMLFYLWNPSIMFFLGLCVYSLICLSCGSCGDDICGTSTLFLPSCMNVSIVDGAILPFIIFWTHAFVFSYCFLFLNLKAPPSLAFLFFLRSFPGDFAITFFLFSNVACIFSLVLLTLACGFCGFSFWWQTYT